MKKNTLILLALITSSSFLLNTADALAAVSTVGGEPGQLEKPSKLLASMFGGIGVFLVGIKFISGHLQHMTGGTFKTIISKVSTNKIGVFLWGNSLGFFTQSGKANSFILAGFVQAGLIGVYQSLPVVYWGNAGSSLIVFASILPIKLIVLFMLGITGLGLTFGFPKRFVHFYGALFGIGMIMYGLYLLKSGAAGFIEYPWLPPLLEQMRGIYILSFLIGVFLTLVAQSDMAVSMIAIAMAASGLFALEESVVIVYGTQGGAALLTYGFSFNFKGRARQVVMSQVLFKAIVTIIFMVLFYVEILTGAPLVLELIKKISSNIGAQVASATLLISFLGALFMSLANKQLFGFIERFYPPSASEKLSESQYLHKHASESPETCLLLIEKEQLRLVERFPLYLDYLRKATDSQNKNSPQVYHEAFINISESISATLSEISGKELSETNSNILIKTTKMQEQLVNLEGIIYKFSQHLEKQGDNTKAGELGVNMLESLDFMILTAIDVLKTRKADEIETLAAITGDRSDMMDRIRSSYFKSEQKLSQDERNFILDITILFENAVTTTARIAQLLPAH